MKFTAPETFEFPDLYDDAGALAGRRGPAAASTRSQGQLSGRENVLNVAGKNLLNLADENLLNLAGENLLNLAGETLLNLAGASSAESTAAMEHCRKNLEAVPRGETG
jgi:hypothetical protein